MLERVMIISGESSGELYGAFLAGALKGHNPGTDIIGVGGARMQSAGVKLISGISSAFGLAESLKTYRDIKKTYERAVAALRTFKPQVLVLIDYPDFNMRVAREAKKSGIKILYYVSPQVWAWRKNRVKVIGKLVDRMAVILPFEEEIYRTADIPCEFVGHPVMDEIREELQGLGYGIQDLGAGELKKKVRRELGLIPARPVMALMPGSRPHEIAKLLPVMRGVITEMQRLYPDFQFIIPVAPNLGNNVLSVMHNELEVFTRRSLLVTQHPIKALLASDAAVIASGTSTLQAALLKVPMVVVYKISPLTYLIGKLIIKVEHISLVNILLGKSVRDDSGLRIRELLQGNANKANITAELSRILDEPEYRNDMVSQLEKVGKLFVDKKASLRVLEIIEGLVIR